MAAAVIGWWIGGTRIALVAGIATPVLGLIAIAWFERWRRVREDVRVFLRASSHRRGIDRVATLRATLTAEFDDVLQRIPEQEPSPST
jgi:hypothetical protein